jgi:adenosylcobinamide-GDP ribazoletransferase
MKTNPFIRQLTAAFSYLTLFFPKARRRDLPAISLAYFPLVGLLLGCLLWLCAYVLDGVFYPVINALVLLMLLTITTRAQGLDGLGSLLDAASKGGTARQRARAMHSHQRGSFGVIAIALALLAKYLLMGQLVEEGALPSLLLFPTLGRWSLVCLVWFFPDQQEKALVNPPASQDFWGATAIALLCALLTQGLAGLGIVVLVWITSYALGRYCIQKIGGITTQVRGAAIELIELFSLAVVVALQSGV